MAAVFFSSLIKSPNNNNNNNNNNNSLLIDVAIRLDKNVIQKETENKLKYKNLSTEIQ
jgi:hypothetical protein